MIKQVIVIRKDLKMRRGKECSQAAHAAMMWLSDRLARFIYNPILSKEEMEWMGGTFTKVTLQVDSEEALLDVFNKAKAKGLTVFLVTDSGKTEFDGVPTKTCCAIGPHEASKIDEITKDLKLY
jgi:PTH2 family peptidyl-tRNA hydrolase